MPRRSRHFGYNKSALLKFARYLKRTLKPLSGIIRLSRASPPFSDYTPCATQVCCIHSPKVISSSLINLSLAAQVAPLRLRSVDEKSSVVHRPTGTHETICSVSRPINAAEACRLSLHRPSSVTLQSVCALPPTSRHDRPPVDSCSPALASAPMVRVRGSSLSNGCTRISSCGSVPTTAVLVKVFRYINPSCSVTPVLCAINSWMSLLRVPKPLPGSRMYILIRV